MTKMNWDSPYREPEPGQRLFPSDGPVIVTPDKPVVRSRKKKAASAPPPKTPKMPASLKRLHRQRRDLEKRIASILQRTTAEKAGPIFHTMVTDLERVRQEIVAHPSRSRGE